MCVAEPLNCSQLASRPWLRCGHSSMRRLTGPATSCPCTAPAPRNLCASNSAQMAKTFALQGTAPVQSLPQDASLPVMTAVIMDYGVSLEHFLSSPPGAAQWGVVQMQKCMPVRSMRTSLPAADPTLHLKPQPCRQGCVQPEWHPTRRAVPLPHRCVSCSIGLPAAAAGVPATLAPPASSPSPLPLTC